MAQQFYKEDIKDLVVATTTTLTQAASIINVGGQQYISTSAITLDFATTGINGLDTGSITQNTTYNIFAVPNSGALGLVASTSATPTGFTNYVKIGTASTEVSAATIGRAGLSDANTISTWISFTPVYTNLTIGNGTANAVYRRVGDSIDLQYRVNFGSTTAVTGTIQPQLPAGLTIDDSKKASREQLNGGCSSFDDSAFEVVRGLVRSGDGYLSVMSSTSATGVSAAAPAGEWNATRPFTWADEDELYIDVRSVPITEWA